MDTGYYISNNYIYGPTHGGQFYIKNNFIHGPQKDGLFWLDGSGFIYGPVSPGLFRVLSGRIFCQSAAKLPLPWLN